MGGNAARWSKDHRAARCYFAFRCLRGVHPRITQHLIGQCGLCLGAACTECIINGGLCDGFYAVFASALPARSASLISSGPRFRGTPLPRRCLHGVHLLLDIFVSVW